MAKEKTGGATEAGEIVSRRSFLKKTTTAGLGGAAAIAGLTAERAEARAIPTRWDHEADVVVIGSGAAGAVAAHALVSAGLEVGIVEEGPWVKTREVREDVHSTFERVMRLRGMQVLQGRAYMPMLQGRCVGGSTLVNSAIAWRAPEDVIDDWGARFGLSGSITARALEPHYAALERDLSVREVAPEAMGENNRLFIEQAARSGFYAAPMRRYDRGCKGSGLCITGCPHGAKQGMSVTYVPWTLAHAGARIYTSCRVDHVEIVGARARTVVARTKTNHVVRLHARLAVIVAASSVSSRPPSTTSSRWLAPRSPTTCSICACSSMTRGFEVSPPTLASSVSTECICAASLRADRLALTANSAVNSRPAATTAST